MYLFGDSMRNLLSASLIVLVALAIFLAGTPVMAQTEDNAAEEQEEAPSEPQIRTLAPAYDPEMMRLAEILGALHYLRNLCSSGEGQTWRNQMQQLIDREEPTEQRRAELVARFNRGYRGFSEIYTECTPAAAEAANRYLRQGIRLSADIPERYGN
jgi:uncharacterized protein (TIGR02301 family)